MRRWTHKQIDKATEQLLKEGKLTEEEVKAFSDPPRATLSEYRENMYKSAAVLCKITGCQCLEFLKESAEGAIGLFYYFEGGETRPNRFTPEEIKEHTTKRSRLYRRLVNRLNKEFDQAKKCRYGLDYFLVCYCDEHNHNGGGER